MNCSIRGFLVLHCLLQFAQTHVHRVSDAIQPSHPQSHPSPPTLNLFQHQGLLKWVSTLHQVPKVLEFQLQHQSFQCVFRVDSFRTDWFDLLAVQGILKSLLHHLSLKASILLCSDFFMAQLSHQYMTTGKTKVLTIWTFVGKVMSLLFNALSMFLMAFLPRKIAVAVLNFCLLIILLTNHFLGPLGAFWKDGRLFWLLFVVLKKAFSWGAVWDLFNTLSNLHSSHGQRKLTNVNELNHLLGFGQIIQLYLS